MTPLRIAIATAGRFHVLDLARELAALGYPVDFYSYVPKKRAMSFGLPLGSHRSLLPFALPALALERFAVVHPSVREWLFYKSLNLAVMMLLRTCDLFIGMSGIYLEAARFAKRYLGATIWLERGSQHILSQDEILSKIPGASRPSSLTIDRELAGYALADRIVIPSLGVAESFCRDPAAHAKLFVNPYGVDLTMFPRAAQHRSDKTLSLLFVGTWSLRKGCDLLVSAVARTPRVRLVHVGSIGSDLSFPIDNTRFHHIDSVPQPQLRRFYGEADAFVLASREDGFGLVLAQALASGLPIICTDRTGGAELAHTPTLGKRIKVIPSNDLAALVAAISELRSCLETRFFPPLTSADRETLSWTAYGRRYAERIAADFFRCGGNCHS
jgi:alpha-maltose-1-phosphate synthase